jgi:glucose-1-phosphate thymidylyltransferase
MIGIVLAGGTGSRLWPLTKSFSKQLLAIYDKPMIHYPIGTLMLAGITKIVIITTKEDVEVYRKALGNGNAYGVEFEFATQEKPEGIAQAFQVAEKIIAGQKTCLILGDNVFHGVSAGRYLKKFSKINGAQIFAYRVATPSEYGVVEFSKDGTILSIEEKPSSPKSNYAIPGLYFFDESVIDKSKNITKSPRGEYEITEIIKLYLEEKRLDVSVLPRGTTWLDTGTPGNLQDAAQFIRTLEERQGIKVNCLEEISFLNGWISKTELIALAKDMPYGSYRQYLETIANDQ